MMAKPTNSPAKPQPRRQCNCKNSRCLKLCAPPPPAHPFAPAPISDLLRVGGRYCECFASGEYCFNCNCQNCCNNLENAAERNAAIEATLERNPNAFRPKIAQSPQKVNDPDAPFRIHTLGRRLTARACGRMRAAARRNTARAATARSPSA